MAKKTAAKPKPQKQKKCDPVSCGNSMLDRFQPVADFFSPFALLGIRLWIANVFWKSGMLKIESWDTTLMLFESEHPVPVFLFWGDPLPAQISAVMGTSFELLMPFLLVIGFGSRLATLPLLVMTAVIQVTYMSSADHLLWAIMLGTILLIGPGRLSWDYFLRIRHRGDIQEATGLSKAIALLGTLALTLFALREVFGIIG